MADLTGREVTAAQRMVLDFLVKFQTENGGQSPSVREIAEHTGDKSPNGISGKLDGLEKRGLIKRAGSGKARTIRVVGLEFTPNVSPNFRIGENFVVSIVGDYVAFMIFADGKMIESGLYPLETALKNADNIKVAPELAPIDRLVKLAEFIVKRRVPKAEPIVVE